MKAFINNYIEYLFNEFEQETDQKTVIKEINKNNGLLSLAFTNSEYLETCEIQIDYDVINEYLIFLRHIIRVISKRTEQLSIQ